MYISNLVIEVTRDCQLNCDHCLRGDTENKVLSCNSIDIFLKQIEGIGNVTFSGGEPSLHPEVITHFREQCEAKKIGIGSFYIATNGAEISDAFMLEVLKIYLYCTDNEDMTSIALSDDKFHYDDTDAHKLEVFSFFNKRGDITNAGLIGEGRANEYWDENQLRQLNIEHLELEDDSLVEGDIYLNCEGNIIAGCNLSYNSQRKKENIICSVNYPNYKEAIEQFIEKQED